MRIFNTYGPRMRPDDGRVVSNFIVQALRGKDITIYGDGSQTRSFCYVDDLIEGLLRLMNTADDFTGPVNLGNPGEFTMLELAQQVIALTGSKSQIVYRPLPQDDPVRRCPDITLAKQQLDWAPTIPLAQGLAKTIDFFPDDLLMPRDQDRCRRVMPWRTTGRGARRRAGVLGGAGAPPCGLGGKGRAGGRQEGSVLVSTIIVARLLGLQSFGAYAVLVAMVMTIATIAQSGTGLVATKYVAEFLATDPARVGRLLTMCRVSRSPRARSPRSS